MAGKHFDLDTDVNLRGENASDITIASQKAVKKYVDTEVGKKQNTLTAGTGISISGNTISATATSLTALTDTSISSPTNGQLLSYNASESKWKNSSVTIPTTTNSVTKDSTAALTSGGAFTNLVTNVVIDSTSSNKINVTKAGSTNSITIDNVANATTASKLGSTSVGNTITPIYLNNGTATQLNYTIAKSVPADAKFTDTTYEVFTGADGSTAGKAGLVKAPSATDNNKFLKGDGTWANVSDADTKNTAGATDTSSKIFLVGATSQAANPQTYSHDTVYVDANGVVNSANPSASSNGTQVATTKWVSDKGYLTAHQSLSEYAKLTDIPTVPTNVSAFTNDAGYLTTHQSLADYQKSETAVTHSKTTAVGNSTTPVYVASDGKATAINYTIAKSVPSDAKFSDTTYSAGTGLSLNGTTINHSNSVTGATAGTSTASSGSTLSVPYVTYDNQGHVTASGVHTHTVTGFLTTHQSLADYQKSETAVTHTKTTAVGNTITPVYIASDGKATAIGYTIAKSVPANANFDNTTYTAGAGLSLSGTEFKHSNSVTGATKGTSSATSGSTLEVPYVTYDNQGHISAAGVHTHTVTGFLTQHQDISGKQDAETAVTHTKTTAVGNGTTPVYIASDGKATALNYTIAKSVPSDAKFSDTTYTASAGITLSGTEFKHSNSVTQGTAGTTANTNGSTLSVPYVTYDSQGHVTASGVHTHTVTGFLTTHQSLTDYQKTETAVTHTKTTAVGNSTTPVYIASDGKATALSYTIAKSVPSNANFENTTYTAGTGLSLNGTQFKHTNSITSGTAGQSTASSGSTLTVPYVTYDSEGHISGAGTHTHTVTGFLTQHQSLANYYTKTEIDGKLTGAMHYKGTVATVAALSEISSPAIGDVYNVTATGDNYAWDGSAWDKLSGVVDLSAYQKTETAVTHTKTTAVGNATTPVYIASDGKATALSYTIAKSVPSDAKFSDTTYTATGGITLSGTQFKHTNSVTGATVGTSTATSGSTFAVPYVTYDNQGHVTATGTHTHTVTGFLTTHQSLADYQKSETAVTHTKTTAVGNTITPVYIAADGTATALNYTIAKSVPANANFDNTTYSAGTGISLSGTTINHSNSVTAGTVGTSTASSGSTLTVPYVTYDSNGHVTATGTRTHTVSGFLTTHQSLADYQKSETAVTHTKTTAVGNTITPVYIASDGKATALSYTIAKSVPANANFENTTYTAGSGLSLSGTQFKHSNSVTAGTVGTSTASSGSTLTVPYVTYDANGHVTATGTRTHTVTGFLTSHQDISGKQDKSTAVTHTQTTAVGNSTTPVYVAADGTATALSYTIAKSVPSDAKFSDTTYSAGTDLSLSGTTFNHKASGVTAGTVGTSTATSGSTLAVPYVTYNAQGHVTATGTHTHTVTGFEPTTTAVRHTNNTAVGNTITPVYVAANGTATALSYTIAKSVPSNAVFTDTNNAVTNTLNTTTKAYVTGTTNAATNTGGQIFDTGVYLDTTAGRFNATSMSLGSGNAIMTYNSTTKSIDFAFA